MGSPPGAADQKVSDTGPAVPVGAPTRIRVSRPGPPSKAIGKGIRPGRPIAPGPTAGPSEAPTRPLPSSIVSVSTPATPLTATPVIPRRAASVKFCPPSSLNWIVDASPGLSRTTNWSGPSWPVSMATPELPGPEKLTDRRLRSSRPSTAGRARRAFGAGRRANQRNAERMGKPSRVKG
jgi:hypothetical protein